MDNQDAIAKMTAIYLLEEKDLEIHDLKLVIKALKIEVRDLKIEIEGLQDAMGADQ